MPMLSIIAQCHNEEGTLPLFFNEVNAAISKIKTDHQGLSVELILVDDGSTDSTLEIIKSSA